MRWGNDETRIGRARVCRACDTLPPGLDGVSPYQLRFGHYSAHEFDDARMEFDYSTTYLHYSYMHRTTILLPVKLRREAENAARSQGITLSELIRRKLAAVVTSQKGRRRAQDALFRPAHLIASEGATDLSARHDDYLYGKNAKSRPAKAAR